MGWRLGVCIAGIVASVFSATHFSSKNQRILEDLSYLFLILFFMSGMLSLLFDYKDSICEYIRRFGIIFHYLNIEEEWNLYLQTLNEIDFLEGEEVHADNRRLPGPGYFSEFTKSRHPIDRECQGIDEPMEVDTDQPIIERPVIRKPGGEQPIIEDPVMPEPGFKPWIIKPPVLRKFGGELPIIPHSSLSNWDRQQPIIKRPTLGKSYGQQPTIARPMPRRLDGKPLCPVVRKTSCEQQIEQPMLHKLGDYKQLIAKRAVLRKPGGGQRVVQRPVLRKLEREKPTIQRSVLREPGNEQLINEDPVTHEPGDKQPEILMREPAVEHLVMGVLELRLMEARKPGDEDLVVEDPVSREPGDEQSIIDRPVQHESGVQQPIIQSTLTHEPGGKHPSLICEPAAEQGIMKGLGLSLVEAHGPRGGHLIGDPVIHQPGGEQPNQHPVLREPGGEQPNERPVLREPGGEQPNERPVLREPGGERPTMVREPAVNPAMIEGLGLRLMEALSIESSIRRRIPDPNPQ